MNLITTYFSFTIISFILIIQLFKQDTRESDVKLVYIFISKVNIEVYKVFDKIVNEIIVLIMYRKCK